MARKKGPFSVVPMRKAGLMGTGGPPAGSAAVAMEAHSPLALKRAPRNKKDLTRMGIHDFSGAKKFFAGD
jgi:hypothetical protein